MLLGVIVAWLVVVGATSAVVGARAVRTFGRVRAAQRTVEERIAALQAQGLTSLQAKAEELSGKTAEMQAAIDRLNRSLEGLRRLLAAFSRGRSWVRALLRIVRG
ncbi:MAG TPA: hypothetical protein VE777_03705 [Gaiellales bacterium]|jgi:peptidoglycan hydrolase CwlO-like protein|nr:hypothetical protein [Gaiellales bacterium]